MSNRLYELMLRKARLRRLLPTDEYRYFLDHRKLFLKYEVFTDFYDVTDDFQLIRANILLQGMENKIQIEETLSALAAQSMLEFKALKHHFVREKLLEKKLDLPYMKDGDNKLFIPFFPRALNIVYYSEPDKLLDYPYDKLKSDFVTSTVDPFETYNDMLFDSFFTKLVRLQGDRTSTAYYHYDFQTIYVINKQGTLDVKIPLFDRALHQPNASHIMERIMPVMDAYFANDKKTFIFLLRKKKLISSKMYRRLAKNAHLSSIRQGRIVREK